jgi:hypothetical protein
MTLSIIPASGYYEPTPRFSDNTFSIPESLSTGKGGFEQQTFLGASIRSFNINAGYGDSTTTLSIDLINDEYNISDETLQGDPNGDDIYHDGLMDKFCPPPVGSPVYFKFGRTKATVDDAFGYAYDSIYNESDATGPSGEFHLCFGGILQSYVQNRGPGGNPLYSAQVVDPREILSNVELILNSYAGTTFSSQNMFNLYGFLEFNPSPTLKTALDGFYTVKNLFTKTVASDGSYSFSGKDLYATQLSLLEDVFLQNFGTQLPFSWSQPYPQKFPITGTGFSRRCAQGIPFYRIRQALAALLGLNGTLPPEYINAGFGGYINFRGHNYIVDLGGLKNIPDYYFFDFDQINLLDFCLEVCDITSSELFVSLLPITSHPICNRFADWNQQNGSDPKKLISGIIRIDSIDKSFQPQFGAIKNYIDRLSSMNIPVENQDVGFELSNVVTDKFIVGAQEVDMYYFSNNNDRDELSLRKTLAGTQSMDVVKQWRLDNSLKQQILPYYGLLGNRAVTIPKGYGSYQQILLDSSSLNANGVGKYYIATELELRAALISYEQWAEFLLQYNDIYMEPIDQSFEIAQANIPLAEGLDDLTLDPQFELPANYAVTVPRCVFDSDNPTYGADKLPSSSCSPPFGYPLYYKRATKLGVQGAGLSDLYSRYNGIITSLAEFGGANNKDALSKVLLNAWEDLASQSQGNLTQLERDLMSKIQNLLNNPALITKNAVIGLISDFESSLESGFKVLNRLSKRTKENALKVYNFVKNVAEECLGKKFLVKIPQNINVFYNEKRIIANNEMQYTEGPFGFRPRAISSGVKYEYSAEFNSAINTAKSAAPRDVHAFELFLKDDITISGPFVGALRGNFNPLTEMYEFNYSPEKQGGYFDFDMSQVINSQVVGVQYGLMPQDFTKFILENSRISAYVRYNNSQYLSFNGIDSDSFSQQVSVGNYFVPDLAYQLDNVSEERQDFKRFDPSADNQIPPPVSVAFVKCDIDANFYMPPKTHPTSGNNGLYSVTVHGNQVEDIKKIHRPRKKLICDEDENSPTYGSGKWVSTLRYFSKMPVPASGSSGTAQDKFFVRDSGGYIKTKNQDLDTKNVYALITIPGRISSTQDSRFRDSIMQTVNPGMLKHFLTMDVVKIPEFNTQRLPQVGKPVPIENNPASTISAQLLANITLEKTINYSLHNRISFASPSPVYPDLVVLPLMSKERCYGPWISSLLDIQANVYRNIGGKIEFLKDENLSPWNYQGYDLMNKAGILQAQFSNSLLLQSERGGFVVPAAPSGVSIGKALANLGPLITNISVDVSNDSIRSTIKMDLYTSNFGKLQKQKQDAIANISRERQKLKDEKNAMIRKGLAKNQTNINYNLIYKNLKDRGLSNVASNSYAINSPSLTHIVASVEQDNGFRSLPTNFATNTSVTLNTDVSYSQSASLQSMDQLTETASHMPNSIYTNDKFYNTGAESIGKIFTPYSRESHNNIPYTTDNYKDYTKKLYEQEES